MSFNNEAWLSDVIEREFLFQVHFWDQSHVTIVWNTRETGDINWAGIHQAILSQFYLLTEIFIGGKVADSGFMDLRG